MRLLNSLFHVELCARSPAKHQQHVDVARRYSRNPARLGYCLRVYFHQLLSGFGGKGLNGIIVKLSFYLDAFQSCQLVCNNPFASDVALVLDEYLCSFYNFLLSIGYFIQFVFEGTDVLGNVLNRHLRPVYQIYQFASLSERGSAELLQYRID